MTIGIDARFYGPSGKGLGRYTQRLIENLQKIDHANNYVVFLTDENWDKFNPTEPNFRKIRANCQWYTISEQFVIPYLVRREKIELMHYPHFNVAVLTPCPFVVTIHDLILLRFPTRRASRLDPITYFFKQLGYKFVITWAIGKSKKVLAVSQYTKEDILRAFPKTPAAKIAVTYEACDSVEDGQLKLPEADMSQYGIRKPYWLYIGNAYPHKNLEKLIDAFDLYNTNHMSKYQLVLVGKDDFFYQRLRRHAQTKAQAAKILFFGFAPQPMLADLYRNAAIYVFPSLLEGFGLPPLEAMRYGLPVAASNSSVCPEVLGDAALYFDPTDIQDMIKAISSVLHDTGLRGQLSDNGYMQVKKYSWSDCAKITLGIYQS